MLCIHPTVAAKEAQQQSGNSIPTETPAHDVTPVLPEIGRIIIYAFMAVMCAMFINPFRRPVTRPYPPTQFPSQIIQR